jgi:hypothetical protein
MYHSSDPVYEMIIRRYHLLLNREKAPSHEVVNPAHVTPRKPPLVWFGCSICKRWKVPGSCPEHEPSVVPILCIILSACAGVQLDPTITTSLHSAKLHDRSWQISPACTMDSCVVFTQHHVRTHFNVDQFAVAILLFKNAAIVPHA